MVYNSKFSMLMLCLKVWCLSRQSWEGASISAVQICFKNCQKHLQVCISMPNYVSLMVGTEKSLRNVIISGYPCSTKTTEVLRNLFLTPMRFPETEEGWGSRKISRAEGIGEGFPNTSQVLVNSRNSPHHQSFHRNGSGNPSLWAQRTEKLL